MSLVCDKHKQLVGESGKREYYSRTDQMVGWFSLTAKANRSPLHFVTLVGFGLTIKSTNENIALKHTNEWQHYSIFGCFVGKPSTLQCIAAFSSVSRCFGEESR